MNTVQQAALRGYLVASFEDETLQRAWAAVCQDAHRPSVWALVGEDGVMVAMHLPEDGPRRLSYEAQALLVATLRHADHRRRRAGGPIPSTPRENVAVGARHAVIFTALEADAVELAEVLLDFATQRMNLVDAPPGPA